MIYSTIPLLLCTLKNLLQASSCPSKYEVGCRGVTRIFKEEVPIAVLSYQKQGFGVQPPADERLLTFNESKLSKLLYFMQKIVH